MLLAGVGLGERDGRVVDVLGAQPGSDQLDDAGTAEPEDQCADTAECAVESCGQEEGTADEGGEGEGQRAGTQRAGEPLAGRPDDEQPDGERRRVEGDLETGQPEAIAQLGQHDPQAGEDIAETTERGVQGHGRPGAPHGCRGASFGHLPTSPTLVSEPRHE